MRERKESKKSTCNFFFVSESHKSKVHCTAKSTAFGHANRNQFSFFFFFFGFMLFCLLNVFFFSWQIMNWEPNGYNNTAICTGFRIVSFFFGCVEMFNNVGRQRYTKNKSALLLSFGLPHRYSQTLFRPKKKHFTLLFFFFFSLVHLKLKWRKHNNRKFVHLQCAMCTTAAHHQFRKVTRRIWRRHGKRVVQIIDQHMHEIAYASLLLVKRTFQNIFS